MGLELEVAGAPAPVNMVAVEGFLLASGWRRNALGKLAPPGLVVGSAMAGLPGQDRGLARSAVGADCGWVGRGAAR